MGDTLSQEEIDNLLSALSTGEINPDELDEADVKSVRNYNFAHSLHLPHPIRMNWMRQM